MKHLRRAIATCLALACFLGPGGLVTAQHASAVDGAAPAALPASVTDLEVEGFGDLAVDEASDRVYVSDGGSTVVVADGAGQVLTRITGLAGADDLVLDGTTLWVAAAEADAIVAVNTLTLDRTTYPVGDHGCPAALAVVEGLVWFAQACTSQDREGLGVLHPGDGTVADVPARDLQLRFAYDVVMESSEAIPGALFISTPDPWYHPNDVFRYDVTAGDRPTATLVATAHDVESLGTDLELADDGSVLRTAHNDLDPTDLHEVADYRYGSGAVATSATGARATGELYVYRPHTRQVYRHYDYDMPNGGALGWLGDRLVAVTRTPSSGFELRVITPHGRPELEITSGYPTNKNFGDPITVRARARFAAPGATALLYEETKDGVRRLLASQPLDGRDAVALRGLATRSARLIVVVPGDADYDTVQDSTITTVRVGITSNARRYQARDGQAFLYDNNRDAFVNVKVRPDHAGECLSVTLSYKDYTNSWSALDTIKCARLSSRSTARIRIPGSKALAGVPLLLTPIKQGSPTNLRTIGTPVHLRFRR